MVLCPSNPWVSIDPVLAVPGIRACVERRMGSAVKLAVSPIIGGQAVKGPAAKMYTELGIQPSALAVAEHYKDLLSAFIIDVRDVELAALIEGLGLQVKVTDTLMKTPEDRVRLAKEVIEYGAELHLG